MSAWFTSDTHFGHKNIIKYSNRPFNSVDEMDEAMIANWNARVKPNDDVYHNGDFAFHKNPDRYLCRLNGRKHLIIGNHDSDVCINSTYWESTQPYLELVVNNTKLVLCHYAMRVWNRSHHGALMLYGHSHGSLPGTNQSLDIGVDCWDYKPVNLFEIMDRMKTLKPYSSGDHHQPRS